MNKYFYNIIEKKMVNKLKKKIISFCLYGINSKRDKMRKYYDGIFVNYLLAKKIYPDWICRIYIDCNVPTDLIDPLMNIDNLEIIILKTNIPFTCIRFLPFNDKNVDIWISRDLDSIISNREKVAVDEWIKSEKTMHIIHDHNHHIDLVMAGMFGIKNTFIFNYISILNNTEIINSFKQHNNIYMCDQILLKMIFNRYYKNNYIQHYRDGYKHENSFPLIHPGEFIGKAYNMEYIRKKMGI